MFWEYCKAVLLGIIEGITEWLPISSTGHLILLNEVLSLDVSADAMSLFLVVVQLGAVLAVVVLYFQHLIPFTLSPKPKWKPETWRMWLKIAVACIPAGVVGLLFDDVFERLFYNYYCVAAALIVFGILFLIIEKKNKDRSPRIHSIDELDYKTVLWIGVFQLIAELFPGTSRSGTTILGALLLGVSRTTATRFTFFMAVPVMAGASLIKLLRFGVVLTGTELSLLFVGMLIAFLVSILTISFFMRYIRKNDFTVFGWYRIVLGILVLFFFLSGIAA